jgi:phosphoenolpyruvate---glycerone phosphotransferase subunit DhaL
VNGKELVTVLDGALAALAERTEELRQLDANLGDGDLGITVRKGCEAIRAKLAALEDPSPAEVLRTAGAAFAGANPSTLAALVGGGLLAAAKVVSDADELTRENTPAIGHAAADSISARGKAEVGDKTILDALVPSLEAIDDGLDAMVAAARTGVEETTGKQSQHGRASWLNERSIGRQDPGATAYVRFLESLAGALDTSTRKGM